MSTESPYITYTIGPNRNTDFGSDAPFRRYGPLGVVTPFFLLCVEFLPACLGFEPRTLGFEAQVSNH